MDILSVLQSTESQATDMMALLRRCWSQSYLVRTLVSPHPDEPATDEITNTHGWADLALSTADYYAGIICNLATMDISDIHIREALASLGHVEHRLVFACSDLMWKFSNLLARTLHLETRRLIRFAAAKTDDSIRNAHDPHQGPRPMAERVNPVHLATEHGWTESEWSRPASPHSIIDQGVSVPM
ncbi:hypothetical protein TI39_contig4111g00001 [Zymoseptoria brevis]|uniref:Uncharacterized protein n=1 Tax=Zymoseptoria brevis TaxID=1047168 RepID=A0A0F4GDJ8_9PEZI|nr:hypothetical protein TI39_contig4111g00001 [Zymoseptoria brevis]